MNYTGGRQWPAPCVFLPQLSLGNDNDSWIVTPWIRTGRYSKHTGRGLIRTDPTRAEFSRMLCDTEASCFLKGNTC